MSGSLKTTSGWGSQQALPALLESDGTQPLWLSWPQPWFHDMKSPTTALSAVLTHCFLSRCPCTPNLHQKNSMELVWLQNVKLNTPLEKLCGFPYQVPSVVGITTSMYLRWQFVGEAGRAKVVGRRRGGHQHLGLVQPPNVLSHKATKSRFNF